MKLFFVGPKKLICLYLVVIITFAGIKSTCFTAQASVEYDARLHSSNIANLVCSPKSITVKGEIWADVRPTGAEVYRAKIKTNGKRGDFGQIGVCNKIEQDEYSEGKWIFTYKDNAVNTGQSYVYMCKGFIEGENASKRQKENFWTRKGVAAKKAGKYKCEVVKNTVKKLVVKITGKSKNNGPIECDIGVSTYNNSVALVFKNKGKEGGLYTDVKSEAFSYNGKKWHKGKTFKIKGKESVYLRFNRSGHSIDISDYQYVQMMVEYIRYNLCPRKEYPDQMPQLRLNLTFGEALTGNFINVDNYKWTTEWDGNMFDKLDDNIYKS